MKLLYKSDKFKAFNAVRSKKAVFQLQTKTNHITGFGKNYTFNFRKYVGEEYLAPKVFSIIENYEETISFLNKVDSSAWHGRRTYANLLNIERITPDSVLYLLSRMDSASHNNKENKLSGNCPKDNYCKKVFLSSGFFKYVNSSYTHHDTEEVLSIRTNDMIVSSEAGAVLAYVREKFKIERNLMTKATYAVIMEAMNNVREHAYEGMKSKRWWLMALYKKECEKIQFALLDNGRGIPATVRKKIPDYFIGDDASLIKSAFSEKNRSETKLPYRGKGLPKIKNLVGQGLVKNLNVISRKGMYIVDTDTVINIESEFHGTLICWDFVKEFCDETN